MPFRRKESGVSHLGVIASAGAGQSTAAGIPYPTSVGLGRGNPAMVEITGVAFANLPAGAEIGDEFLIYTRAGATPTINVNTVDTLIGAAVVMAASTMISMQCIDKNATTGVCTWIREG